MKLVRSPKLLAPTMPEADDATVLHPMATPTKSSRSPESAPTPPRRAHTRKHVVRIGALSFFLRPRVWLMGGIAVALLLFALIAHLMFAGARLGLTDVLRAITDPQGVPARVRLQVNEFRLPRVVAGILAGAALAVSGALTQNIARNPLATPEILGVNAGASLGAVGVLVMAEGGAGGLSGLAASVGVPVAAGAGALIFGAAVFLLAWRKSTSLLDSNRMVLTGLGATALATSLVTWMLTLGDVSNASVALTWMSGSLNGRDWEAVAGPSVIALVLLFLSLGSSKWLFLGAFDQDTARSLGLPLSLTRAALLLLAVALAALGTVLAGPVAFVALLCPLLARALCKTVLPPLAVCALLGAIFVLFADLVAGFLLPNPLPVGVLTTVIGAPVLIILVLRLQRKTT